MEMEKDIRALSKNNYGFFLSQMAISHRNQVYEWLWRSAQFEDMTNPSKETRTLQTNFVINHIKVDTMQRLRRRAL
jgi:23S rRNA (adenine2503-C2)-methyltransferase